MRHHSHLTLEEREDIMCLRRIGTSISQIVRTVRRNKLTISRELSRNS
jgi:IS30 family transposase